MYSYINSSRDNSIRIPEYQNNFNIQSIIPILWLEHCTECAMPLCYKTCSMYVDRGDGRCRRFINGIVPFKHPKMKVYGATIEFKRWSKLECCLHSDKLVRYQKISLIEKFFNRLGKAIDIPCRMLNWKWHRPSRVYETIFDKYIIRRIKGIQNLQESGFLMTVFNHEKYEKRIHFEILLNNHTIFHKVFILKSGWNEHFTKVRLPEILNNHCLARIYMDNDETGCLTFQTLDFINSDYSTSNAKPAEKVKCVAWDLDNTLWYGIIGDDGKDNVIPRNEALSLIKKLDEKGIIQTIVSKNEFNIAWEKIKELGLEDYFISPAINWGTKSESIKQISQELNINVDTFAVLDDSIFERNEISASLPQVRVYDSLTELDKILSYPEFDIPVTLESKKRRISYLTETRRKNVLASWDGNYTDFLASCKIELRIFTSINELEQMRCYELIQRSNQYNISQNRRDNTYINKIIHDPKYKVYAFSVKDKFGDYGIVGFSSFINENNEWIMQDFVMSCRVAQKMIEQTFIWYISSIMNEGENLIINISKTSKNSPLQEAIKNIGLNVVKDEEDFLVLKYSAGRDKEIVNNNIIQVINHKE